jgi:hypothetical protein
VREIEENIKLRQMIIPLSQFDTRTSLVDATLRKIQQKPTNKSYCYNKKTTDHCNSQKTTKSKINLTGWGLIMGGSHVTYPHSPLVMCESFCTEGDSSVRTILRFPYYYLSDNVV